MGCISGYNQTSSECSQTADQSYSQCTATADQGYSQCTATADQGYSQCDDWGFFSFLCDGWVWVSNVVCVASTWISNVVCVAATWIVNVVCVAWNVITVFVCVVWDVVTAVINVIVETVESILAPILNALALVIELIFAIPGLGRILNWIWNVVTAVISFVIGVIDTIAGILGIRPEKRMLLVVFNQLDERRNQVATHADILASVALTIQVYRDQANVRVLPLKLFNYKTPASDDEQASEDYIIDLTVNGTPQRLDVDCGAADFAADLGFAGSDFQNIMTLSGFWTNWRRLTGYGAPVCAFSVRSFSGSSDGCSLGPLADYVLVNFTGAANDTTAPAGSLPVKSSILPHEMGHACNLWHVDPPDLMAPSDPRATNLKWWQIALVRSSRHVTYF